MADYQEALDAAVYDPNAYDEVLKLAKVEQAPETIAPIVVPLDPYSEALEAAKPAPRETSYLGEIGSLLGSGFQRGVQSFKALPSSMEALAQQTMGNEAEAVAAATRAQEIEAEGPQKQTEFSTAITNFGDFGRWLAETAGEQAPNILASIVTGGTGAVVAQAALRNVMLSTASRRAMITAAAGLGGAATNVPLETAGTLQEQFGVTGTIDPKTAVAAGLAKGALETIVPMRLGKALFTPGTQIGLRGIGREAINEAATEGAQEGIDIFLRKQYDPNYSFFGGPNELMGPGAWRLAESMTAGFALGGAMAGGTAVAERIGERGQRTPWQPPPTIVPPGMSTADDDTDGLAAALGVPEAGSPLLDAQLQRARGQGWNVDETLYHGTRKEEPFQQFEGKPFAGRGPPVTWLTPSRSEPDIYNWTHPVVAVGGWGRLPAPEGARTMPVYLRKGKQLEIDAQGEKPFSLGTPFFAKEIQQNFDQKKQELVSSTNSGYPGIREALEVLGNLPDIKTAEKWGNNAEYYGRDYQKYIEEDKEDLGETGIYSAKAIRAYWNLQDFVGREKFEQFTDSFINPPNGTTPALFQWAADNGYESVRIKNMTDNTGRQTQIAVLNPERNIRGKYAEFAEGKEQETGDLLAAPRASMPVPGRKVSLVKGSASTPLDTDKREIMAGKREFTRDTIGFKREGRLSRSDKRDFREGIKQGTKTILTGKFPEYVSYEIVVDDIAVGHVHGTVVDDTLHIEHMGSYYPLDRQLIKDLREIFRKEYPSVKKFSGVRVSGARSELPWGDERKIQTVKLKLPAKMTQVMPGVGPVSYMRKMLIPSTQGNDWGPDENPALPRQDLLAATPILNGLPKHLHETYLDLIEANTSRYAWPEQAGTTFGKFLYNDVDLQFEMSRLFPATEQPMVVQVDQGSLTPEGVTADPLDLSEPNSERVWFLTGVKPEEKYALLRKYMALHALSTIKHKYAKIGTAQEYVDALKELLPPYEELLKAGLRVIPSRGATFMFAGQARGDLVDVRDAARSPMMGMYNAGTREIDIKVEQKHYGPEWQPVAWDMNRFKEGELSRLPERDNMRLFHSPLHVDGYVPPEQAAAMHKVLDRIIPEHGMQWTEGQKDEFRRYVMQRGFYYPVGSVPGRMITKYPQDMQEKMVHGMMGALTDPHEVKVVAARADRPTRVERKTNVMVEHSVLHPQEAKHIRDMIKRMAPAIDSILRSLGIRESPDIFVGDMDETNSQPFAYMDSSKQPPEMVFYVPTIVKEAEAGDLNRFVRDILFHELGHYVTLSTYRHLSLDKQLKLQYAWKKAQLTYRTDVKRGYFQATLPFTATRGMIPNYTLSYIEWLAEQFRRWTLSAELPVTEVEKITYDVAQEVEKFYTAWTKKNGKEAGTSLTQPSAYFSAMMKYLRGAFGRTAEENSLFLQIRNRMQQQDLYWFDHELMDNPEFYQIMVQVQDAIDSLKQLFPNAGLNLRVVERLLKDPTAVAQFFTEGMNNELGYIELALGAMKMNFDTARVALTHELIHTYRNMNLLTDEEFGILYRSAVDNGKVLPPNVRAEITRQVKDNAARKGWGEALTEIILDKALREETVAYYVGDYANSKIAFDPESRTIMEKLLHLLRVIWDKLRGTGHADADSILRAIFRGEVASRLGVERRYEEWLDEMTMALVNSGTMPVRSVELISANKGMGWLYSFTDHSYDREGNLLVQKQFYRSPMRIDTNVPRTMQMQWYTDNIPQMYIVGKIQAKVDEERGTHIEWIESDEPLLGPRMVQELETIYGLPILSSDRLTPAGMAFARKRFPELLKYYVLDPEEGHYFSPKEIDRQIAKWNRLLTRPDANFNTRRVAQEELDKFVGMRAKVPKDLWFENAHYLDQMYMLDREKARDGVQKTLVQEGIVTENTKAQDSLGQPTAASQRIDGFSNTTQRAQAMSTTGSPMPAPQQPENSGIRRIWEWWNSQEIHDPEVRKYLQESNFSQELDRIGHFTKLYWSIHQLAWRNLHIPGLRTYTSLAEQMHSMITRWHERADNIARDWERNITGDKNRINFGRLMFWLTDMQYLSEDEKTLEVVRHPSIQELEGKMRELRFNPEMRRLRELLYVHPFEKTNGMADSIFSEFLNEVEQVSITNIIRAIKDPVQALAAVNEVKAEIQALRDKPYFPIARFGKFVVISRVSDVDEGGGTKAVYVGAFPTLREAQNAVPDVARQYPGNISVTQVPEKMFEFMALPQPLIKMVREQLPEMVKDPTERAEVQAWLENFERLNMPDKSFRKRWLPQTGTPGYSMDAFRVFSHYFMNGSRYLARLKYAGLMRNAISNVQATIGNLPTSMKRRMIVDYMSKHFEYIMQGARDFAKLKAAVATWQLGLSPAAAGMNLTQTLVVTPSYFSGFVGTARGFGQVQASIKAARNLRKGYVTSGFGNYYTARQEAISQGRIDIGQAAELGSYAEGNNLLGLLQGTKAQKYYRQGVNAAMYFFQKAEQVNREIAFHAAWEIAHKYKDDPKVREALTDITQYRLAEIQEMRFRLAKPDAAFTIEDAAAFLFAKDAIDKTQGIYAPYARPAFLQNRWASFTLIFFQFMQMMSYAYRFNPGQMQLIMVSLALYGIAGAVPGGEDLMELIALTGRKLFGEDWDLKKHTRKFVRDMTMGTVMEETGPDIAIHGLSRFGFGMGLFPEIFGGFGKFDASANGSLGKLVPGLFEAAHSIRTDAPYDQFVTDLATRLAGPGFGAAFNVAQFMLESKGSTDSHTWEKLLPRAVRAPYKAYRMAEEGGEKTSSGARIAKFDVSDPEDLHTLVVQALGLSPTQVNVAWEVLREQRDVLNVYKARRVALYAQYARALRNPEEGVIEDVQKAIRDFNEEVRKDGDPSMQITSEQIRASMRNRERARILQERGLPTARTQMPVARRVQEMYPNWKPVQ